MGNWVMSLKETRQGPWTVPLAPIREFDTHKEKTFLWHARNGYTGGPLPYDRYDFAWRMLERLQRGQWIDCDIIWAYTNFQQRRIDEARTQPQYHIMSPSFFKEVINEYDHAFNRGNSMYAMHGMRRLAKQANLVLDGFCHRIFLPFDEGDNHWILLSITIAYHPERNGISASLVKFDPAQGHREDEKYEGGEVPDFDDQFRTEQEGFELLYFGDVPHYEGDMQSSALIALFRSLPNELPEFQVDKYTGRCIYANGKNYIPANCGYWVLGFIDEHAFGERCLTQEADIPSYRERVRDVVTDELRTALGVSNIADVAFDRAHDTRRTV